MQIKIISSYNNAHLAKGLTIIVDVLRAFTTCCYIINNKAERVIPVANLDLAYTLIKKNPSYVSIGERNGLKIKGFDYGNSPEEISKIDLEGKTVIFTTSAGTQGLQGAVNAHEIITGAFVNAEAIISYIKKNNPKILSFIVTNNKYDDNEDFMFVKYVINKLNNKPVNFEEIKNHLINHPSAVGFLKTPLTKYAKKDFFMSLELDKFSFVIKAKKINDQLILEKM